MKSIYDVNDTMRMLGNQDSSIAYNGDARKQIDEIAEARPYSFTLDAAADIFMLGYIYGKRAERTKKKK